MLKHSQVYILFLLFFAAAQLSVYAQTPPSSQTAGGVDQREKAEEKQKAIEKQIETKREEPVIEEQKPEEKAPKIGEQKVLIKRIIVEDVTLLPQKEINKIVAVYEGKELTLSEMQKVADKITDAYRNQNRSTSRAYLPQQTIKDGILVIKVIEGKVGKITIRGNRHFKTRLLEKKIKLKPKDYFNYSLLQDSLAYINENPDIKAKAVLVPGEVPGTTDIIVEVKDKLPIHAGFRYNDFGSRYIEKNLWGFIFEDNNLFGFEDRLSFQVQLSQKSLYTLKNARYVFPVNQGLNIGAAFAHSRVVLGKEFRALSAVGKATVVDTFLNQKLISNRTLDIRYNFIFTYKHIVNYIFNQESSRDDLRIVKNGLDIDITDKFGRTIINPEIDVGIPRMWGALTAKDSKASRTGSGGQFVKGVFNFYRLQPLPFSSSLLFKNSAQLSNYNLCAAEQFQIGGAASARGFAPGEHAGDRGIYSSVEWSIPPYFVSKNLKVPFGEYKWFDVVRFVTFYDWANARINNPESDEKKSETLRSWGYGIRFNMKDFALKFELGYPLGHKVSSDGNRAHPWVEFEWKF